MSKPYALSDDDRRLVVAALRLQQRTDRECQQLAEAIRCFDVAREFQELVDRAQRLLEHFGACEVDAAEPD